MSAELAPLALAGEGRARGLAHGRALKARIDSHLDAWLGALAAAGVADPPAYVRRMVVETDFRPAIAAHAPDLLAEVEGIAEGAGQPFELVFGLQLLDEEWAYRLRTARSARSPDKCSTVGLVGPDGETWVGQNMDLGAYTAGHQALLAIAGHGEAPAALVFTVAGMIGLMGVNAAGVAVCVNSLPQLPSGPRGLPVAFVLRRLLQAPSAEAAIALVRALPHATNQHYLIGGPGQLAAFEASCEAVTEFVSPHPRRVLHTNHPLSPQQGAPEPPAARENSVARLASLENRLAFGDPDLEDIQAALCAFDDPRHPVCRLHDAPGTAIGFTTGSIISRLRPGAVESWVSNGPPSVGGYVRHILKTETVA